MLFLIWADEYRYGKIFEDTRKAYFLGRDEYTETVNGAYELLVRTSRQFGGRIIRGGRKTTRSEHRRGGKIRIICTQARGRGDQDGNSSTPGSNLPWGNSVPGRDG